MPKKQETSSELEPLALDAEKMLRAAMDSEHGIVVRGESGAELKAELYRARRALREPELGTLELRTSPDKPETDVWIVKAQEEEDEDDTV